MKKTYKEMKHPNGCFSQMGVLPKWVKPMALGESDIVLESNPFMPFFYSRIWN
jgi:hypothetical protein